MQRETKRERENILRVPSWQKKKMNGMSVEKMKWMGKRDKTEKKKKSSPSKNVFFSFFLALPRTYVKHKFVKQQKGELSAYIHSTYCLPFGWKML